jgi:uncharacterized protein YggE
VSGEGKAFIKPDIAQVTLGATTQELKSQDAVNKNNTIVNAVIAAIKKLGVEDKDIQTTSYNLSPWYDYTDKGSMFKGYQLNQQITVKIRNFDNISAVLDAATSQGATNAGDLQFTVDDPVASQADARQKAIDQAKEKAMDIADQSGLRLVKLVNVAEGNNAYPGPIAYGMGAGPAMDAKSVAPQIQTGQQEVDSTVTLTYLLK